VRRQPEQSNAVLLDDFVGTAEDRNRYIDSQPLGSPEIDIQLDFGRLLDRQVSGPPTKRKASVSLPP
jgi:hypothetical protein